MEYRGFKINSAVIVTIILCFTVYIMISPLIRAIVSWTN